MNLKSISNSVENSKYLNWKVIVTIYLLTRITLVLLMFYGTWNGESLLCYNQDCKARWWNVELVVQGRNPYEVWKSMGGYLETVKVSDRPPFFYILTSTFVFLWNNVWSVYLIFFLFDFLNTGLIYNLAKFKKTSTLLYLFAPSIFRGLLFTEDEIFVTFLLASIYFFNKKRYSFSTLMLTLSTNLKVFPVILLPVLLISMHTIKKSKREIMPQLINYGQIIKQTSIFILISLFLHLPWFPSWSISYKERFFHQALGGRMFGFWGLRLFPTTYYPIILTLFLILFYFYFYVKNLDIKTGYLLGSLIFISLYPGYSFDHFIFLIPLFLVWTKLNLFDMIFWLFLSVGVGIEFLGLPSIGIITSFQRDVLGVLILLGFYFSIINYRITHKYFTK